MTDQIDLAAADLEHSPDVARWAQTLRITDIRCTAAGGFEITFDRAIPDSWKWPSAPPPSTDNFQYTVWIVLRLGDRWVGAGFVQMWQGRAMGTRALPPLFADVDDVPGYRNWWGDPRRLWPTMVDHVPVDGEHIGILVTAGNGRLTDGVTSVAERSNVVLFPVRATDDGHVVYLDPPVDPPVDPPAPPASDPRFDAIDRQLAAITDRLQHPPVYEGQVAIPAWLGTGKVTLTPKP
jgi:hypothetical protein